MSGGRCHRRKMMGRGAEGGCGAEERPCPVSRVSSNAAASTAGRTAGVGLYVQARKALSERSPFDDEEALARVATLPVGLAAALSRSSDGRRKHRKAQSESVKKAAASAQPATAAWSVWTETEEYFRPISLADIDKLVPKLPFGGGSALDSCLTIPHLRSFGGEETESAAVTATGEACASLAEAAVVANGPGGVLEVVMGDGVNVKKQHEKEQQQQALENAEEQQQRSQQQEDCQHQQQVMEIDEEQQQHQSMEIDEVRIDSADGCVPTEKYEDLVDYSSLNWILSSKSRALLASERPNKKRKLLGSDAGLDKLLLLPRFQGEDSAFCDYCCLGNYGGRSNRFLHCDSCKVSVHMKCYGVDDVPEGAWLCSWCKQSEVTGTQGNKDGPGPCLLCPKRGGALKPAVADISQSGSAMKFAHLFCSLWMPEVYIDNIGMMEPIKDVEKVQETRKRLVCNLCKVKQGACIRCSHGTCRTSFHPVCAREARQRMEIWGKCKSDDVELRAFCSKHSTFQDVGSVQPSKDLTVHVMDHPSVTSSLPVTPSVSRIPKIRITRKERDKSAGQENTTKSSFGSVIENEIPSEHEKLGIRVRLDSSEALLSQSTLTLAGKSCNAVDSSASDTNDLLMILKKLSDRGKISVADVALEMEIPSDSLESALAGDTALLPCELKLKIIKWFEDYVHLGGPMRHLNSVGGCTLSLSAKDDGDDGTDAARITGISAVDAVLVKSLPPRRRTKSNVRILKDNKVVCSSGEALIDKKCNGKLVNEIVEDRLIEDVGDATSSGSLFHDPDHCGNEQDILKKMQEDASGCSEVSSFGQQHQQCNGNSMVLDDQDGLVHYQQHPSVERMPSFGSDVNQDVKLYDTVKLTSDNVSMQERSECDVGTVTTGAFDSKTAEPYSSACVHPFIQKKLITMQNVSETDSNGLREEFPRLNETDISKRNCDNHQSLYSSSNNQSRALDDTQQQLAKARGLEIMELCPEDELEGEILYLQDKLLSTAVTIKHRCENLMLRVVRHLPEELDFLKKRRWDLVVVNQFLRHVREAKKRGRKEKRHKEYQAVLAAAAAAVETSSRVSSLRKEVNDALISSHPQVDAGSGRAGACSVVSRTMESPSKLTAPKLSLEKQSETNAALCDVCGRVETMLNRIYFCGVCKVAVHLDCYRRPRNPISSWLCDVCEELQSDSSSHGHLSVNDQGKPGSMVQCGLCGAVYGAFRKTITGQWVHSFCAEWVLESTFRRGQENPVEGMEAILKDKEMLNCCICYQNTGICMKCSYGHCQVAFHPFCARRVGLFMSVKTINGKLQHKAYCEKHGMEQREKADAQQFGVEELKSIKQIRVELEKVRLLCERIIRREKLKRELVLCSHDILASRRDYVAFSLLVNSSFFPPGISSESATTSINNRSYSDTIQRSDDVTVDSSVSTKRKFRLPLQTEIDRKTEDSSTSRLASARKGTGRMSFSGKQIPHRQSSVTSRSTMDGEKRLKQRKHVEIFQKEVVMTSDQASIQNRRLPKGFVYVPVDSLPKSRNIETREPRRPDG